MNFQFWDSSTASNMLGSIQKGPFPSNVSSYFRRPSKIVKPSSRNNSPRTASRRRMTTTGHMPVRTRSVVDYQRASMPQLSDTRDMASRPISWHPNMLDEMSQYQMAHTGLHDGFMNTPYTTVEINGLVTPMSYPLMDEPQIQELITPLEGLSANETGQGYGYSQDFDMTQYWLSEQGKDSVIDFDPSVYPMMNYQPQWYPTNQYIMPNIPTAPTSPSFLPMPEFGAPLDIAVPEHQEEAEELVAMGLYDSPADVQSSSLLFGGFNGATVRKSLKLEDSFEPSPNDDDEEDATAEEDDEDQPGVSPTDISPRQNFVSDVTTATTTDYVSIVDNSYMMNQWQVPAQSTYGWI